MTNYWAITIGINQYRHLQPLVHAQNDARYVHRFLTEEAGIPAAQCVLLSDLSTSVNEQIVYPDKSTINEWVQTITHQVQPDDVLWVFWSGYGVQIQREDGQNLDYLMPIDGDPEQIESTGIAATDLIDTLAGLPTDKTLLVLDINRSQGTLAGQSIGSQLIDLAEKRQVPILLSCQPEQYSHGRIFGLRPGLFTSALLEALQQNCQTIEQISTYLDKRLPELCLHHLRPVQNPVSAGAGDRKSLSVMPTISPMAADARDRDGFTADFEETIATGTTEHRPESLTSRDDANHDALVGDTLVGDTLVGNTLVKDDLDSQFNSPLDSPLDNPADSPLDNPANSPLDNPANSPATENRPLADSADEPDSLAISGARLRNWGLLTLSILMIGVLLKQPFVGAAWNRLTNRTEVAVGGRSAEGDDPANNPADNPASEAAETSLPADVAGISNGSEETAAEPAAETTADVADEDSKIAATGTNSETAADEAATAQALMGQANAALGRRQYSEALNALQQVPQSQRDEKFSTMLTEARAGNAEAKQTNASVLADARQSIQPTQASQFTQAIAKARLIQPGEPAYEAAQQDIRSWSQVILDIAEGRATSGNLEGAIAAAKVMPYDSAEHHKKAQEKIAFWNQRQQSRKIIAQAQTIPKLGEASTYQQGIVKLREVPLEHPEHEIAQRLADQWSESIFSIAQARAAQGRDEAAIQAALLVPAGTIAYEPTQKAIRRWQSVE